MSYVSPLDLATPEQVIQTQVKLKVFPVPELPVIGGLMCTYDECGHLCASGKRMKSHWLAVHGVAARVGLDWKAVKLQTFFRGNLLRYFTNEGMSDGGANAAINSDMADAMNFEVCSSLIPEYAAAQASPLSTLHDRRDLPTCAQLFTLLIVWHDYPRKFYSISDTFINNRYIGCSTP